jgi:RNA repair pathway DNA polymerase beta family
MVITKIKFGSHLYGTSTPESDTDYKSVYVPEARDILLQRVQECVRTGGRSKQEGERNTSSDVDNECYSLQRYLQLLAEGQTGAIDMLFAPEPEITTPLWRHIQANKNRLLTKKSAAFVGYCRTQANKYGIKGSRVAADTGIFKRIHEAYGDRARLAESNEGIDWKALSHAVRVGREAIDLLNTGRISFPLPYTAHLLDIKRGKLPYAVVAHEIELLLTEVENNAKTSTLRDEPDQKFIDDLVATVYGDVVGLTLNSTM